MATGISTAAEPMLKPVYTFADTWKVNEIPTLFPEPEGITFVDAATGSELLAELLFKPQLLAAAIRGTQDDFAAVTSELSQGAQRIVYIDQDVDGWVYKIPHAEKTWYEDVTDHVMANLLEAWLSNNDALADFSYMCFVTGDLRCDREAAVMPCRILWHESGIPVVVMEQAEHMRQDDLPDWCASFDGEQAGWSDLMDCVALYDAGALRSSHNELYAQFREQTLVTFGFSRNTVQFIARGAQVAA